MKFCNLIALMSLLLIRAVPAHAQTSEDFGLDDEIIIQNNDSDDISEVAVLPVDSKADMTMVEREPVVQEEASEVSEEVIATDEQINVEPQTFSAYVQALNLSDEQIDTIKYLNKEYQLRQEQLLRSVDLLKEQAKEIEQQSLREFEAVLTPQQREVFKQMQTADIVE